MLFAVFAFATVYAACAGLLLAVSLQDRRRGAAPAGLQPAGAARRGDVRPFAREPRLTQVPEFVFRTHA